MKLSANIFAKRTWSRGCLTAIAVASLAIQAGAVVTVVSNLGETGSASLNFSSTTWLASSFTTDGQGYTLDSISLSLDAVAGSVTVTPHIFADAAGAPSGSALETFTSQTFSSGSTYTFNSTGLSLSAGTTYWIAVSGAGSTGIPVWFATASTAQSGSWTIGDTSLRSIDSGATWPTTSGNIGFLSVDATPVPEPEQYVLVSSALLVGFVAWRRYLARAKKA